MLTVALTPHVRRVGLVITILGLTAIALATLLPEPPARVGSHFCLLCGSFGGVNAILNVLLFVPIGIGLGLCGIRGKAVVLGVFALSVLIELAQLGIPGRYSTLGDVLTNTVGGAIGFAAARYARTWLIPTPRIATNLLIGWCFIWLSIQAVSSFAFSVSIPDQGYYAQIARKLGHFDVFQGRVVSARIDDVVITDTRLRDDVGLGSRLRAGGIVAVTLVPAGPTRDIAPIVRVADTEKREIVLLGQAGRELVFGIRTGAAILRLRPPLFAAAGVFPNSAMGSDSRIDALSLSARYKGNEAELIAVGSASRQRRIVIASPSLGWILLLPFQWLVQGTASELIISWIWMAALMLPAGYWGSRIGWDLDPKVNLALTFGALLGSVAILIAGLLLVPHAFAMPAAPVRDWLAAVSGMVAGAVLTVTAERTRLQRLQTGQ